MWECHGWRGLGEVSEHYIRGKDMTGFAAGVFTHFSSTWLPLRSSALFTSMHASLSTVADLNQGPNTDGCHVFLGHISGAWQLSYGGTTSSPVPSHAV